jgi:hypothetical protein
MSSSKKIDLLKDFAQVFICLRPRTPYPPLPYTLYTSIQYTFSHTGKEGGGGGRVKPERRLEGQQFTKLGQKYQHY